MKHKQDRSGYLYKTFSPTLWSQTKSTHDRIVEREVRCPALVSTDDVPVLQLEVVRRGAAASVT